MTTISASNLISPTALSPVQQVLNSLKSTAPSSASTAAAGTSGPSASDPTDYQDQDWFITAKVAQLKSQLALYQAVPGLDPDGSIQDSITAEANTLVAKQNAKVKAVKDAAAAQQAALDKQTAQNALDAAIPSATDMISRAQAKASGKAVGVYSPNSATPTVSTSDGDTNVISSNQMLANAAAAAARGSTVNKTA